MEQEKRNPEDIVAFDVPLFIRLLEFAREDATDDAVLHKVTENIIDMCQDGQVLSMDQYDQIVDITPELDTSNMNSIHERKNKNKMNEINLNRWAKLAGINENESMPTIQKIEKTELPIMKQAGKTLQVTLSNGKTHFLSPGDLEGIYGGDSEDLDYFIGQEWDQ